MTHAFTNPLVKAVCAGESMVMFAAETSESLNADTRFRPTVAGAESNVACYLSMLGIQTSWVSRVGSDPFGQFMIREISQYGVDTSGITVDQERPTGVAFKHRSEHKTKVDYFRYGSAASALAPDDASRVHRKNATLLHLSGITSALSASSREFVRTLVGEKATTTLLSYDVNWRPSLWDGQGPNEILHVARQCDVVFVGLDEANSMWGVTTPSEVRTLLPEPSIIVVKQGESGLTTYDSASEVFVPSLNVDVVEPVGAGDALAGGFLAGLSHGLSLAAASRLGVISASSSLSSVKDVGVLPPVSTIERLLNLDEHAWRVQTFPPPEERKLLVADC